MKDEDREKAIEARQKAFDIMSNLDDEEAHEATTEYKVRGCISHWKEAKEKARNE